MTHKRRLTAALLSAAMAMAHSAPAMASTITADQFTQDVIAALSAGNLEQARGLLLRLQTYGIKWLEIDGVRYEVDTLIDQLRGGHPHAASVIGKLTGASAIFVQCDDFWQSKANINAPSSPPPDLFPTGSHGAC